MYKGGFNMASYTQHYQLHQWEPNDNFLRTDFNTDLEKIDTAIHAADQEDYIAGTYTGDGAEERVITLGFTPSAMFLERANGERGASYGYPIAGLLMTGFSLHGSTEIAEGGFKVYQGATISDPHQNETGVIYRYLAFQ